MGNVVPPVVLLIGFLGVILGLGLPFLMKSLHRAAYETMQDSVQGARQPHQRFPKFIAAVGPGMFRLHQLVFTVFGWLMVTVGVVTLMAYAVGFFGVNVFALLLGQRR